MELPGLLTQPADLRDRLALLVARTGRLGKDRSVGDLQIDAHSTHAVDTHRNWFARRLARARRLVGWYVAEG